MTRIIVIGGDSGSVSVSRVLLRFAGYDVVAFDAGRPLLLDERVPDVSRGTVRLRSIFHDLFDRELLIEDRADRLERIVSACIEAPAAEYLPVLVTGWLSPHHCGLHGARVQASIHRAGGARWRTRAVEVRRRQPRARATRRRPQAAIVKQVRKALRRMARETGR